MHLLYLDDLGSVGDAKERHVILAGAAVYERSTDYLSQSMDRQAQALRPDDPAGLEFHGSEIHGGAKKWRRVPRDERATAYKQALQTLARTSQVRLFAAVIHQDAAGGENPMELAFEHVINRFDRMLSRLHHANNTQRGLIVLDESAYETSLQRLSVNFRSDGHWWGRTRNIADVPLFVNSRDTRLIQYADLVAHATRRYYNAGDANYFDVISRSFDSHGGQIHGFLHWKPDGLDCNCVSCRQRPRRFEADQAVGRLPWRAQAEQAAEPREQL